MTGVWPAPRAAASGSPSRLEWLGPGRSRAGVAGPGPPVDCRDRDSGDRSSATCASTQSATASRAATQAASAVSALIRAASASRASRSSDGAIAAAASRSRIGDDAGVADRSC